VPRRQAGIAEAVRTASRDGLAPPGSKAAEQALEVVTDRIFPFDQIADAFAYLEQGRAHGKVIVQMV
jgi:NADPH:quinone reductase-like Zn-dependent oxidoreductase